MIFPILYSVVYVISKVMLGAAIFASLNNNSAEITEHTYVVFCIIGFVLPVVFGIVCSVLSFVQYKKEKFKTCIYTDALMKGFLLITLFEVLLWTVVMTIYSAIIIFVPFAIIFVMLMLPILYFCEYVYVAAMMIPSAFYGVQRARILYKDNIISKRVAVFHGILQFIPGANFISTAYMALKGRSSKIEKVLTVIISVISNCVFLMITVIVIAAMGFILYWIVVFNIQTAS